MFFCSDRGAQAGESCALATLSAVACVLAVAPLFAQFCFGLRGYVFALARSVERLCVQPMPINVVVVVVWRGGADGDVSDGFFHPGR